VKPAVIEPAASLRKAVARLRGNGEEEGGANPAAGDGAVVADALRLFLTRYAAAEGLPLGRVLYCFVLRLIMQLDEWRSEAVAAGEAGTSAKEIVGSTSDLEEPSLGALAMDFGAYPVLAHFMLEGSPHADPDGRPDAERISALGKWLDQALPIPDAPIFADLGCSRVAACCALPFAMGYVGVLPENRLRFVSRALLAGDSKAVRYALNYITGRRGHTERVTPSGAPEGRSGEAATKGSAAGAASGVEDGKAGLEFASHPSSSSEDSSDDDDEGETDSEDEQASPRARPFRTMLRLNPELNTYGGPNFRPPSSLRPSLTQAEFHGVVCRLGDMDAVSVMQLLGYECPPYARRRPRSGAEMIMAGKPYMPRAAGSVLRAYLREVHGDNVDELEPDVRDMQAALPK
jgi:hypothetical protein